MKSFFGNAIVKKSLSLILILAVAAIAFATPLKPQGGFGDAKVYDSSYKAIQNPQEVSDNFVIRTSSSSVILNGGTVSVEVEANSLLQFISLDGEAVFYLLDGRAIFSTDSDFEVRTPVTNYKAQAGTAIYVITDDVEETAFVNVGKAEATNLITNEVTEIGEGKYIDNSKQGFSPASTTRNDFWKPEKKTKASEQAAPQPVIEEPVAETVILEAGALEHTFSYRGIRAVLRAYIGIADLEYPEYITSEDIDAAARAAVLTFPQTITQDISYEVVEPGLTQIYYPETYGETEFAMAVYLIDQELPGYIDALLGPVAVPEQQVAVAEEPAQVEPQPEQPAAAPQAEVKETIESKVEKPAETPEEIVETPVEESKETDFRFGLSAQIIYCNGTYTDDYKSPAKIDYRTGLFYNSFSVVVDPILNFKDFTIGFHFKFDVRSGKFVNPFKLNTNGFTGITNTVMKYISLISYENGNFSIRADRTTELEFKSPVFSDLKRAYSMYDKLLGTVNYNNGAFKFTAFVDDLQLEAKVARRSQYAGFRASYTLGRVEIGASAVLNFRNGINKKLIAYPAVDVTVPFEIKDIGFEVEAGAAVQYRFNTEGKGLMVEAKINKTSGTYLFGFGTSLTYKNYFNDFINNGPVDVVDQYRGLALDFTLNGGINTKFFKITGSYTLPIQLIKDDNGGLLVYNTVFTKNNKKAKITADTFNIQADVEIGKFTFSTGAVYNGLTGRLSNIAKAFIKWIKTRDDKTKKEFRTAFAALVDPEISTLYAQTAISFNIGSGVLDAYVRADLVRLESNSLKGNALTMPVSAGIKYTF